MQQGSTWECWRFVRSGAGDYDRSQMVMEHMMQSGVGTGAVAGAGWITCDCVHFDQFGQNSEVVVAGAGWITCDCVRRQPWMRIYAHPVAGAG